MFYVLPLRGAEEEVRTGRVSRNRCKRSRRTTRRCTNKRTDIVLRLRDTTYITHEKVTISNNTPPLCTRNPDVIQRKNGTLLFKRWKGQSKRNEEVERRRPCRVSGHHRPSSSRHVETRPGNSPSPSWRSL